MPHINISAPCAALKKCLMLGVALASLFLFAELGIPAAGNIQLNRIIAVINGELISMYDLQQRAMPEIMRRGIVGGDSVSAGERNQVLQDALDSMILDILYRQEAERYQITADDSEVENEVRRIIQENKLEPAEFERQLAIQGLTMADLRKRVRESIMRQRLLGAMVSRKAEVTPSDIENYYNSNMQEFSTPSSVEFSVIMMNTGDPAAVSEEIKSGRISFAEAARQYSESPTAALGGSMGEIAWNDLNPAWRDAMQGLDAGQTSDPAPAGATTLIFHVDALHEGNVQSLEEATAYIEEMLREDRLRERFDEYSSQLRAKAVVEIKI